MHLGHGWHVLWLGCSLSFASDVPTIRCKFQGQPRGLFALDVRCEVLVAWCSTLMISSIRPSVNALVAASLVVKPTYAHPVTHFITHCCAHCYSLYYSLLCSLLRTLLLTAVLHQVDVPVPRRGRSRQSLISSCSSPRRSASCLSRWSKSTCVSNSI